MTALGFLDRSRTRAMLLLVAMLLVLGLAGRVGLTWYDFGGAIPWPSLGLILLLGAVYDAVAARHVANASPRRTRIVRREIKCR